MSLRKILAITIATLSVLTLAASVSPILLTTYLHRAAVVLSKSVESVRLAEEAEIDLLLYSHSQDSLTAASLEADLRRRLLEARQFVISPEEMEVLATAQKEVDAFFSSARHGSGNAANISVTKIESARDRAFSALEDLVNFNVAAARVAKARTAEWDRLGNLLGIGGAVLLIPTAIGIVWWLYASAFYPLLDIASKLERFSVGERNVRAAERGPSELRNLARRFNDMSSALERQRETQFTFLASVAHDLRNPLSALMMSVARADRDKTLTEEESRQLFTLVRRQVAKLDRMVGDLLDTARIEAGQLELKFEVRDIREIVQDVAGLFQAASPKHRIELSVPEHSVMFQCDPIRIEQALNNLVSNAIKYSPEGGRIGIQLKSEKNQITIAVSDEGIGIQKHAIQYIFEPFRRAADSRNTISGVGLGLFVAQEIAKAHGGCIEVESSIGKGSVFRIHLPIQPPRELGEKMP